MEEKRDFKGVWIPKEIWLNKELNALEKVILTEIDSLDNSEKGCYASNQHIAEFCQCSETKVSTAISKLIKMGYLYVQNFDGRKRELKSRLSNFESQNIKKCKTDIKKIKQSNTSNSTDNNTEKIIYIINHLNEKAGTKYRASTPTTQNLLKALLTGKNPFTVEDCILVIDKQCAKWKGTEWEQYLRPSTLFGKKFENYLNAKNNTPNTPQQKDANRIRTAEEYRQGQEGEDYF